MKKTESRITVGWREWVALPELGLPHIKAKIDTGARTSALHAFFVEPFEQNGEEWVRFGIHPIQENTEVEVICTAPVADRRMVTDSGGHKEERYTIYTPIHISGESFPVEITLTNRDTMKFRMLVGRTTLDGRFVVNPEKSYLTGK